MIVSATVGTVAAGPLTAQAEETKESRITQITYDEAAYQALEKAAIKDVEQARMALQQAQKELAEVQAAAKLEVANAEQTVTEKNAALEAAKQKVEAAKQKVAEEEATLEETQKEHDAVVAAAQKEIDEAQAKIDGKEQEYLEAKEGVEKAQTALDTVTKAHQKEEARLQTIINKAEEKMNAAAEAYEQAKAAFRESEEDIQRANLNLEAVINHINDQQNVINQAITEKAQAQHAVEDAQIRLGEANANYPVLQAATSQAKTIYEAVAAAETSKLPMLENEISTLQGMISAQEGVLAGLDPSDPTYGAEKAKLDGYNGALQYAQNEKNMMAAETAQTLTKYTTTQAAEEAGHAELLAAETAYQESLGQREQTNNAADKTIAEAQEIMNNREQLIIEAETAVQKANINQEKKIAEMNQAQLIKEEEAYQCTSVIQQAKEAIAKSLETVTEAEKNLQKMQDALAVKEQGYNDMLAEQQPIIDSANQKKADAKAKLQAQKEAVVAAEKLLAEAKSEVNKLEKEVAAAKEALAKVKASTTEKIQKAKAQLTSQEQSLKNAEDRLAGLRAGANDARSDKPKATNVGMSIGYQQGYDEAYALLSMTSKNLLTQTATIQQKNVYIKEYKKVVPATDNTLPQTGDVENLAAVLMGLGLITISGAALLKKKYVV